MQSTNIEWTDTTWNPVTGCTKISIGCLHCYAERMTRRIRAMGVAKYRDGFSVHYHQESLLEPFRWKQPRRVFVCSMSDLFHGEVPSHFIAACFATMKANPQHTFQILTKRIARAKELIPILPRLSNAWIGTSIELADYLWRIKHLKSIPASVRFLSLEPLLAPIPHLPLVGIHWVIVGGETGPGARPMNADWVRQIRDRCVRYKTPFFFKGWGGINKKKTGRLLDGRTWDEFPNDDR